HSNPGNTTWHWRQIGVRTVWTRLTLKPPQAWPKRTSRSESPRKLSGYLESPPLWKKIPRGGRLSRKNRSKRRRQAIVCSRTNAGVLSCERTSINRTPSGGGFHERSECKPDRAQRSKDERMRSSKL